MNLNLGGVRESEFPWAARGDQIFLNHASTGPLPLRTLRALEEFTATRAQPWRITFEMQFGTLARSRELCARLIGARPDEIALMVNTTYGLNLAARALPFDRGDVVITSEREYPSNVYPWAALERARGVMQRRVPTRGRLPDEDAILAALDAPRVRALVLSWVSFETGYRVDLERLGAACRERGIWFIVDAIQGVGASPIDVGSLPVDVLACGGQKWLLSPWGSGFVYVRGELVSRLEPVDVSWMATRGSDDFTRLVDYDFAWRENARRFEMITLPYQEFAALNASLELFFEFGIDAVMARVQALATRIVDWACDRRGVTLVTPAEPARRAGVVSLIPAEPELVSDRLTRENITHSLREGAIRLSPHWYNTEDEVDRALEVMER